MQGANDTIYAIGDVHGRADLLEPLLEAIAADVRKHGGPFRVIFLGDIIDRGPDSRGALDLVAETLHDVPESRLILGNHEEFLLRFLDQAETRQRVATAWFHNGGIETLASYGFDSGAPLDETAAAFSQRFAAHVAMLRAADWMVETDGYRFVHGGVDPLVGLDEQDPVTTRWIRHDFLDFKGPLGKIVVHGHTPTDSFLPEIHANRIAIDTGAVFSGHLTCAILQDGPAEPRFLATDDHGREIAVAETDAIRADRSSGGRIW